MMGSADGGRQRCLEGGRGTVAKMRLCSVWRSGNKAVIAARGLLPFHSSSLGLQWHIR